VRDWNDQVDLERDMEFGKARDSEAWRQDVAARFDNSSRLLRNFSTFQAGVKDDSRHRQHAAPTDDSINRGQSIRL
jgi:hypothetical protein